MRRAVRLIETAGGLRWANHEARRLLGVALAELEATELPNRPALEQIGELARYIVERDR